MFATFCRCRVTLRSVYAARVVRARFPVACRFPCSAGSVPRLRVLRSGCYVARVPYTHFAITRLRIALLPGSFYAVAVTCRLRYVIFVTVTRCTVYVCAHAVAFTVGCRCSSRLHVGFVHFAIVNTVYVQIVTRLPHYAFWTLRARRVAFCSFVPSVAVTRSAVALCRALRLPFACYCCAPLDPSVVPPFYVFVAVARVVTLPLIAACVVVVTAPLFVVPFTASFTVDLHCYVPR